MWKFETRNIEIVSPLGHDLIVFRLDDGRHFIGEIVDELTVFCDWIRWKMCIPRNGTLVGKVGNSVVYLQRRVGNFSDGAIQIPENVEVYADIPLGKLDPKDSRWDFINSRHVQMMYMVRDAVGLSGNTQNSIALRHDPWINQYSLISLKEKKITEPSRLPQTVLDRWFIKHTPDSIAKKMISRHQFQPFLHDLEKFIISINREFISLPGRIFSRFYYRLL